MEADLQSHQILVLTGSHASFSLQALLMGDKQQAVWAVMAAEAHGFKGSSAFQFEATRLGSFVRGLDRLRRGEDAEAVLELPQYPDCKIAIQPTHSTELALIKGVIGSVIGVTLPLADRVSVHFEFNFERGQLSQLCNLSWSRPHMG